MKLAGSRILLTGASGGIGAALAARLAQKGARLALAGRRREVLDQIAGNLGEAFGIAADLTDEGSRNALVEAASSRLGGIDLLINSAGTLEFQQFADQDPAAVEQIMQTNLLAPMLLTHAVLPHMRAAGGGRIVNVGSIFGSIGFGCFAAYSASKFGLRGFSEALRRELEGSGIEVTYIAPRATRTPLNSDTVTRMNAATGVHMDTAEAVADRIVAAIEAEAKERYLGWPESLFVRINAILPRLVDGALRKQHAVMRDFASGKQQESSS